MAAVAVRTMPVAAFDPKMLNFRNIGRTIVKTSDFMALDLAKVGTAVSKYHDFDQRVKFKAELLLPDINNLYFVNSDQPIFNQ